MLETPYTGAHENSVGLSVGRAFYYIARLQFVSEFSFSREKP